jgi:hypothetical protein
MAYSRKILEWRLIFAPQIDFVMLQGILADSGYSFPASITREIAQ